MAKKATAIANSANTRPSAASGSSGSATTQPSTPPDAANHQPSSVSPSVGLAQAIASTGSHTSPCSGLSLGASLSTRQSAQTAATVTRTHHSARTRAVPYLRLESHRCSRVRPYDSSEMSSPAPAPNVVPIDLGLPAAVAATRAAG